MRKVRKVQHHTNCTTKTCFEFIRLFEQYVDGGLPAKFTKCDQDLKTAAGIDVFELNGCAKCHGHVYGPEDKRTECPRCGAARYDVNGKAYEVMRSFKGNDDILFLNNNVFLSMSHSLSMNFNYMMHVYRGFFIFP